jgi:RNA polymerase sigma-70 factor (ECF subfamily)
MAQQDAQLIRRWQGGDRSAFEELVRRWQAPISRCLARLVGRPELVQDLCQEVFLRLYQAGPRYREQGTFATWIYRIALNVARDACRRSRHAPQALGDHEPVANGVPAETHCEQQELTRAVSDAIADLTPPLREVLVLRHYEDMNFEDMARLLKTPASTLKSRFSVALCRLRERLRRLDYHPEETP